VAYCCSASFDNMILLVASMTYCFLKFAVLRIVSLAIATTKTYDQLTQLLNKHLSPKPLIIAERYRFYKRDQQEGESVNEYVAQLRKLSKYCEFSAFLNDALRDKIVCGVRNVHMQKRLLSESELTQLIVCFC
jgi:hypothetical protein